MEQSPKKPKGPNLKAGDVFELEVPDGRLGYGVIVLPNSGAPYVIILRSLHRAQPTTAQLATDEIALVGWTMDALIYHGRWRVVGHDFPTRMDIPAPNFKVGMEGRMYVTDVTGDVLDEAAPDEADVLDYQFSRAPVAYQQAFEAMHGFGEWKDDYEKLTPSYARQRMSRRGKPPKNVHMTD
jgi:hypothetical protein